MKLNQCFFISKNIFKSEEGSTLIENLVAFTLLTGVVILLISITIKLSTVSNAEQKIKAITLAQSVMEETIYQQDYSDKTFKIGNKWDIQRKIEENGYKRLITIRVLNSKNQIKLAELKTIRLATTDSL
jgi:Tfp pilus assembly protein PilV